ncbi:MAG: rod shape-determining protein MreC [Lachnospiraceae bacterium]|nr:rod shape-determining protein MreC [Lachnospiraceae bacterium]
MIIAIVLLFISYATGFSGGALKVAADYVFVPMQKGLDTLGSAISVSNADSQSKQELIAENEALEEELKQLRAQLINVELQRQELMELQELFELSQDYYNYETTAAHVIARGQSNWFSTFTIDKGKEDGLDVDMNIIADGGLVGIITDVGAHYAVVRSIIDDNSSVSATVLSTGDNCIVTGSISAMNSSYHINMSNLEDEAGAVVSGEAVVTSNISNKFVPGIMIGYIDEITDDENGLTKSGTIIPIADFKHLKEVLIIKQVKFTGE